jgi:hypothetical protein
MTHAQFHVALSLAGPLQAVDEVCWLRAVSHAEESFAETLRIL